MLTLLAGMLFSLSAQAIEFDRITISTSEAKIIFRAQEYVSEWCRSRCYLEVKDRHGELSAVDLEDARGSMLANIETMEFDRPYRMTLVEAASGNRSSTVEFVRTREQGTFYYR